MPSIEKLLKNNLLDKNTYLLQNYHLLHIDEVAVVLIMQIEMFNQNRIQVSAKALAKIMNINSHEVNNVLQELVNVRKLVRIINNNGKAFINTDNVYISINQILNEEEVKKQKQEQLQENRSMIKVFEDEFQRPLSPVEKDIIKEWAQNFSDELILNSLRTAVMQGTTNLRYIEEVIKNNAELLNAK